MDEESAGSQADFVEQGNTPEGLLDSAVVAAHTPPNLNPPTAEEKMVASYADRLKAELIPSRVRNFYDDGIGAFEENRRMHSEDLNFVYNSETMGQWDPVVLEARRGKPCYTFNRVLQPVSLVISDMRQCTPNGKVRPLNDVATEPIANVKEGLLRDIESRSRADEIYKQQFKYAVAGGYGAWFLVPEYAGDDTFDQVLRIKNVSNPQTVVWDPECNDPCAADSNRCIIADRISKDMYHAMYPEHASETSFYFSRDSYGWFTDKEVRIADYWERVPFEKEIALLSDGRVVDYTDKQAELESYYELHGIGKDKVARVVRRRTVMKWRVMWCKVDGSNLLEGPVFYDWKRIPVVRVPGRYINIEGRKKLQSLIRHSKDAQRNYNTRVSDMIERSALMPKAPYLVTQRMIEGYENEWQRANIASRPFLPYNVDKEAVESGGMPQRIAPIDMPMAALALAQQAAGDIQATTGFFDPALGNGEEMNRVSGKALVQHTRRSDLGSFEFIDGFGGALQLTWDMGLDMIPTIYDSARVIRIAGSDGVQKMVAVNQTGAGGDIINDLKAGEYDCVVTIGPSFQTQRQETLETMIEAAGVLPALAALAPDLIAKNIDVRDADEMTRRLRISLIQQGIVQPTPEEAKQLPPPPQPDPMQQLQTQRLQALTQKDAANATLAQHKTQMMQIDWHDRIVESAGKHLANLLSAQKLGQQDAAFQAEQAAGRGESAPDT